MLSLKLSEIKNLEVFSNGNYIPPDMQVVTNFLELLEVHFRVEHGPDFYGGELKEMKLIEMGVV